VVFCSARANVILGDTVAAASKGLGTFVAGASDDELLKHCLKRQVIYGHKPLGNPERG